MGKMVGKTEHLVDHLNYNIIKIGQNTEKSPKEDGVTMEGRVLSVKIYIL